MPRVIEETDFETLTDFEKKTLSKLFSQHPLNFSRIAKTLKTSKERISYNLTQLKEKGILNGFVGIVDAKQLGFNTHIVYFRLQSFDEKEEKNLLEFFSNNKSIKTVGVCSGNWDFYIVCSSRTIFEFEEILTSFRRAIREKLYSMKTATFVSEKFKSYAYLGSDQFEEQQYVSYTASPEDFCIIRDYSNNPRKKIIEIAKTCNISPQTASTKIKQLFKSGIIKSVIPRINISKLGRQWYVISVYFRTRNHLTENHFESMLESSELVAFYGKVIGSWDYEIDVHVKNSLELHTFLKKMRSDFKELILNFETTLVFKDYQFDMFPKNMTKLK